MLQIPLLRELVAVEQFVEVAVDLDGGPNAEVDGSEELVIAFLVFISLPLQELAVRNA